jgi:hypothetical protein
MTRRYFSRFRRDEGKEVTEKEVRSLSPASGRGAASLPPDRFNLTS